MDSPMNTKPGELYEVPEVRILELGFEGIVCESVNGNRQDYGDPIGVDL